MIRNRHTYLDVYNIFKKENWTLLSSNYKDTKQSLEVLCSNNHKVTIKLNNFLSGDRCFECSGRRRLNTEIVKKEFEKEGYILLSNYVNSYSKLNVICPHGHHTALDYAHFYTGRRCGLCFGNIKYTLNEVRDIFKKKNYTLLSSEYIDVKTPLKVQCDKGHITKTIRLSNFIDGTICHKCSIKHNMGENNYCWNPHLTNEDRLIGRHLRENGDWIQKVLKRDNYQCQVCKDKTSNNFNAHHLEGYHWCEELRFEISNGVTLCKNCHKEFHHLFGMKWNTSEQFYQFLRMKND